MAQIEQIPESEFRLLSVRSKIRSLPIYSRYPRFTERLHSPRKFKKGVIIGFGFAQVILGITCFVITCNIIGLGDIEYPGRSMSFGYWSGILFIPAGIIGILSVGKSPCKWKIITSTLMSMIAAAVIITSGVIEIRKGAFFKRFYNDDYSESIANTHIAFGNIMIVLAFAGVVSSVIISVLSYDSSRCKTAKATHFPLSFIGNQPVTWHFQTLKSVSNLSSVSPLHKFL